MKIYILLLFLLFSVSVSESFGQLKLEKKYITRYEKLNSAVWDMDRPEFKLRNIPDDFKNYSKVIIASHTGISTNNKTILNGDLNWEKAQNVMEVNRELIYLNDNSSVENYSEIEFTLEEKNYPVTYSMKKYMGAKIYKSDGSTRIVGVDNIVIINSESYETKAKLAIPDLQQGDYIDYFIITERKTTNDYSTYSYDVLLFDDAPILHKSFHAELDKKYAVEYRNYNGAKEPQITKNASHEIIIDISQDNIKPFETDLWVNGTQQLPFIRLNMAMGVARPNRYMQMYKPGVILRNQSNAEVLLDFADQLHLKEKRTGMIGKNDFFVEDAGIQARYKDKSLSTEERVRELYYLSRMVYILAFDINAMTEKINIGNYEFTGMTYQMVTGLRRDGITPAILVYSPEYSFRITEVMKPEELKEAVLIPEIDKVVSLIQPYSIPFEVPYGLEGSERTKNLKFSTKKSKPSDYTDGKLFPYSSYSQNCKKEIMEIMPSFDQNLTKIKRTSEVNGYLKESGQRLLVLYEDYYNSELKALGSDKTIFDMIKKGKTEAGILDEVRHAFDEARKNQKEAFKMELKNSFQFDTKDLTDYEVTQMGVRHDAPAFIFKSSFVTEDLIKKAGKNYLFEVGKLQGSQINITEKQKIRNVDINMGYARSYVDEFNIIIPPNYTVEGVEKLNQLVENSTGLFECIAITNDNSINIKLRKIYKHANEELSSWEDMQKFMDAAFMWGDAKLLFKKN